MLILGLKINRIGISDSFNIFVNDTPIGCVVPETYNGTNTYLVSLLNGYSASGLTSLGEVSKMVRAQVKNIVTPKIVDAFLLNKKD